MCEVLGKPDFSVHIWAFHSIPGKKKKKKWNLNPQPYSLGCGLANVALYSDLNISCNSRQKKLLGILTHPVGVKGYERSHLCANLDISFDF